jgi:hypothetical protein
MTPAVKAKDSAVLRDFPGLASRPDALDLPPGGAILQENLQSHAEGELSTRPGTRQITFEEE